MKTHLLLALSLCFAASLISAKKGHPKGIGSGKHDRVEAQVGTVCMNQQDCDRRQCCVVTAAGSTQGTCQLHARIGGACNAGDVLGSATYVGMCPCDHHGSCDVTTRVCVANGKGENKPGHGKSRGPRGGGKGNHGEGKGRGPPK